MTDNYIEELEDDEQQQLYEHLRIVVDKGQMPLRIDKYMFEKLQHTSRNRIQRAADAGFVHVNDVPVKSNYKVRPLDVITLMLDRPQYDNTIEPEDIPLDVVYEDSELIVINKPAGLFSPAADADSIDDMADDMIEMTDEEGNTTLFKILDYFFYNGDEYAILTDSIDEDTTGADRVDCYVMKIVPTTDESGEELEEFVPVEDQKLEAKLMEIATLKLNDDEQADDED